LQKQSFKNAWPVWAALAVPVLYLAAVAAYAYAPGMTVFDLMERFSAQLNHPLAVRWTAYTPRFLLGALALYAATIALYYSTRQNRRPGVEHGSAAWGDVRALDRKYRDRKHPDRNVILTQHLQMGLNGKQHRRNLLQIIIGGSGAGKTRFLVKPNVMLANASYICTDPKGEIVRAVGPLLLKRGYVLRVFDLVDPAHSDCYNPFRYIRKDADVFRLIDNLIKNTTPKNAANNDPFWEKSETALDSALMLYLLHEAPPEEQNMEMILTMIEYGGAKEDDDDYKSPLDLLFEALEEEQPDHIAVREYKIFKQAAGKTAKSILVGAAVRLSVFTLHEVQDITARDTLELEKLGERRQAIFCVIPDSNDNSLNFLVGMLYTQAFQELYYQADKVHGGSLPIPVRLMFDEFANVALPDGYARLQATMRSRNIMATIILQNISQLKALFKDDWEGIIGNADTLTYLGGNEKESHKYISELLGKETIDTTTSSRSRGRNGSYSQNFQQTGRDMP
jgi:type IV secretion system protein VirD4